MSALGVDTPVGICVHSHQSLASLLTHDQKSKVTWPCRTLADFELFFSTFSVEGIVVEHRGRFWKVKAENFGSIKSLDTAWPQFSRRWKQKVSKGLVLDQPQKHFKEYWHENLTLPGYEVIQPFLL